MSKVLITGGAGNIGSVLAKKLLDLGEHVLVADNLSTGSLKNLPEVGFIKCDVNTERFRGSFDYIFHLAAVVGVKRTQENPISVLNDINGIRNILNMGAKRVFFASSSEVYGEPVSIPQNEEKTPLNSRLPYAVVKNVGEAFCRSYHQEQGQEYTIFRIFNTYGPNQSDDFVIPRFVKAAKNNEDITIYGDGSQTRTFTHVNDTVDTFVNCLYNNKAINDVVNVGSDKLISILDLAKLIIKTFNSKSKIVFLPPLKDGDMTRRQPDNKKMMEILNRDLISLEEGLWQI